MEFILFVLDHQHFRIAVFYIQFKASPAGCNKYVTSKYSGCILENNNNLYNFSVQFSTYKKNQ